MRVRSVNEKAVGKLINFLTELKTDIDQGLYVTAGFLQTKHGVSKSSYSACRKLNIITAEQKWNIFFKPDRQTAIKILELLRQRSDKQVDAPISDLWVQEITAIKGLLTEVRDNTKKQNNRSEGFKINERVYLAGQIASGIYDRVFPFILNPSDGASVEETNNMIIKATDDLLLKLNQ